MKPFTLFEELCHAAEPADIYAGLRRADALTPRGLAREQDALQEIGLAIQDYVLLARSAPDVPGSLPSGPGGLIWKRLDSAELIDAGRHGWMMEILINDPDAEAWHVSCPGCETENIVWAPKCRSCGASLPDPA